MTDHPTAPGGGARDAVPASDLRVPSRPTCGYCHTPLAHYEVGICRACLREIEGIEAGCAAETYDALPQIGDGGLSDGAYTGTVDGD